MNLPCEIVQDLLPLMGDELCSDASRAAVEEHLKTCPACRGQWERVWDFEEPKLPPAPEAEEKVVKSIRKVRRRWWVSLVASLLVLPVLMLCVNQVRGTGVCFGNLDDILKARAYCKALADGDFEKAAAMMDCERLYEDCLEALEYEPEDVLGQYAVVNVDGELYMAAREFCVNNDIGENADGGELWNDLIFNGTGNALIPEEAWNAAREAEPDAFLDYAGGVLVNGKYMFYRMETQWGVFYTDGNLGCRTAEEIVVRFWMMPVEIFNAGKGALEEMGQEGYEFNQERYGAVAGMSYEEFAAYVREAYAAELQSIADTGYAFRITGNDGGYYIEENGCWIIEYGMKLVKDGKAYPIELHISVREGGIHIGAMSGGDEIKEFDLAELIFFGYPSE